MKLTTDRMKRKQERLKELNEEIKRNIQENALLHKERAKIKRELGVDMSN